MVRRAAQQLSQRRLIVIICSWWCAVTTVTSAQMPPPQLSDEDLGGQGKTGHLSTLQNRPFPVSGRDRLSSISFLPLTQIGMDLRAPAARSALEHMGVMEQPIEQRGDRRGVAEQLAPIIDGSVRREQRGGALVAPHDQLEEIFGGGVGELAHAEVVDDQERDGRQFREVVLARAGERGLGEFFEQRVRLAIDDAIALQDRGAADRLGQVALAGAGRPEEEDVLALGDEAARWRARRRARDSSSC